MSTTGPNFWVENKLMEQNKTVPSSSPLRLCHLPASVLLSAASWTQGLQPSFPVQLWAMCVVSLGSAFSSAQQGDDHDSIYLPGLIV